jgi:hypothetical protein
MFEPFIDLNNVSPQVLINSVKRKGKGLYKRTISAAIPSTEEDVAVNNSLRKNARPYKLKTRD